jgi:2-octaprenylphenol hydroxylase
VDQLRQHANVELNFGVELAAIDRQPGVVVATTQDGRTVEAAVLVAADGSASVVRSRLEIPTVNLPYGQDAVVAHIRTEKSHAQTAWQRFLRTGPVALLPLDDGRSSVVWSMPSASAEKLLRRSDADFGAELTAATDHVLGRVAEIGDRASFPLRAVQARQYCSARVALIGDAAHTVHPLAGQGMNLGLLDAAAFVDVLEAAVSAGEDPGDMRVLRRYERRQKGRNLKTLLTLDALHRLFTRAGPLLAPVRATGLSLVDGLPVAKRVLMREALGLTGELPNAAKTHVA